MASNPDPHFYDRSTAVINLCNSQIGQVTPERVATSAAYAAACFSVWMLARNAQSGAELQTARKQAINNFVEGYRQMLETNFDDYVKNHETYFSSGTAS